MASGQDTLVMVLCTGITHRSQPNTIQPFIKYLESGKPFTPDLRRWLIELLKDETDTGHSLEYKRKPGRRTSFEEVLEDASIYDRACSLRETIITPTFCKDILSNTNLVPAPDAERSPSIYRLGWYQSDYMGRYVEVALSLKMGKRLNSDQVHKIVAAEFCVSVSKVKRVLSAREEAESSD
jgi:hypothetical protein